MKRGGNHGPDTAGRMKRVGYCGGDRTTRGLSLQRDRCEQVANLCTLRARESTEVREELKEIGGAAVVHAAPPFIHIPL